MNKRIAISVITVLAVGVSAAGYFVVQQSNKLGEAGSEIVALEENGSILEVKLTDLEAKVSTLEADLEVSGAFYVTNPDCVSEITIDRISVFAYDGRVVYEGPFLHWREEIPWTEPMKPHETRSSELEQYVSGFEWPPEAPDVWMNFTVEIFWSGAKDGLPLTGWVSGAIIKRDSAGHLIEIELAGTSQMLNMEQALDSED